MTARARYSWSLILALAVPVTLTPIRASAQLPSLVARPLPAALQLLDFEVDSSVAMTLHNGLTCLTLVKGPTLRCANLTTGSVRTVGRGGTGPGEFSSITGVTAREGGLLIADGKTSRLTAITSQGTIGAMTPLTFRPSALFRATQNDVLTMRGNNLVSVALASGAVTNRFAPGHVDSLLFAVPAYDSWGFFLQQRRNGGWLVAAFLDNNIVALDSTGRKAFLAHRALPAEFPATDEVKGWIDELSRINPQLSSGQLQSMGAEFGRQPKGTALRQSVAEDAAGRLWVVTPRLRADSTELDVYSREGQFIGTRRVTGRVAALAFVADRMMVLTRYQRGENAGFLGLLRFELRP